MIGTTTSSDVVPMEAPAVPFLLPTHFERFYRAQLRFVHGSRLRSRDLHARYGAWAAANGGISISLSEQREYLEAIGHRHLHSDGIHYADITYAEVVPGIADTLRLPLFRKAMPQRDARAASLLIGKVDDALAALLDLRRAIVAAKGTVTPHVAAQIAIQLGLDL